MSVYVRIDVCQPDMCAALWKTSHPFRYSVIYGILVFANFPSLLLELS